MNDEIQWAWLAGFYDGEGCTLTHRSNRYAINLVIMQNDKGVLEKAQSIAGGTIIGPFKYGQNNSKPCYRWSISSYDNCTETLERMWPYLSEVKQKQAVMAYTEREIGRIEAGTRTRKKAPQ